MTQQLQCKSESAQCSETQQSSGEGEGGGLKFEEEKNAGKQLSPQLKNDWTKVPVSCILYFFIHPNPITYAEHGPGGQGRERLGTLNFLHR